MSSKQLGTNNREHFKVTGVPPWEYTVTFDFPENCFYKQEPSF